MKLLTLNFLLSILLLISWAGCGETESQVNTIHLNEQSESYTQEWNQIVRDSLEINLEKSDIQDDFTSISSIGLLSSGELVVPNGYMNTIYVIQEDGTLKRKIHKEGRGPGEFVVLGRISVDEEDNIYVYDPSQRKMIVFYAPGYTEFYEYFSKEYISNFIILDGLTNIATYSPYTEYLFNTVDFKEEELLHSSVLPGDENFKTWLARIQTGGIVYNREDQIIYGLYPEKLKIYKFTKDLTEEAYIIPETEESFYKEFPSDLDPYDHTVLHEEWWSSFDHLRGIHLLAGNRIAVTWSGGGRTTERNRGQFINVYDLAKNKIIAESVKMPARGNLIGADGNTLFISFNATLDENNREIPFRLFRYEFN